MQLNPATEGHDEEKPKATVQSLPGKNQSLLKSGKHYGGRRWSIKQSVMCVIIRGHGQTLAKPAKRLQIKSWPSEAIKKMSPRRQNWVGRVQRPAIRLQQVVRSIQNWIQDCIPPSCSAEKKRW